MRRRGAACGLDVAVQGGDALTRKQPQLRKYRVFRERVSPDVWERWETHWAYDYADLEQALAKVWPRTISMVPACDGEHAEPECADPACYHVPKDAWPRELREVA